MKLICAFILTITTCSIAYPSVSQGHDFRHNENIAHLEHASDKTQLILDNVKNYIEFSKKVNLENKIYLEQTEQWDQACLWLTQFEECFFEMHKKFLDFRESLADCISINDGNSPMAETLRSCSIDSFTDWYFHHIETMILPYSWDVTKKSLIPYSNTNQQGD